MPVLIEALDSSPVLVCVLTGLISLMVGSFLNVVIHRLPIMMERDWRSQCRELLELEPPPGHATYNLLAPRSRCPQCGHQISWWENIPIISYLMLKAHCSSCRTAISIRYPLVEFTTALLSLVVVWQLGVTVQAAAMILLTWALIALSMIDIDHQLLPDSITYPFLWLGLLLAIPGIFLSAEQALIGAAVGYLSLWSFYWVFKLLTGKEGMGYGDFKLLALFGAWAGWADVFLIILLSSVVGAAIGIGMILFKGHDRRIPIPFGPYLAIAGWVALLWGDRITDSYLQFAGIG